eukprot:CAMPEP_0173209348 /NCGR_PEP_ID=MMETSP1141-20130122/23046_1 /TAXON_ID=483371 /ORGANISM="non described non described, Strain CCMP2298" /LENGTH=65 /DNA_ID=CAMNT_0014135949 /DNA_START=425 /DNA_END=622 /DNA_ORIENTATION=+
MTTSSNDSSIMRRSLTATSTSPVQMRPLKRCIWGVSSIRTMTVYCLVTLSRPRTNPALSFMASTS